MNNKIFKPSNIINVDIFLTLFAISKDLSYSFSLFVVWTNLLQSETAVCFIFAMHTVRCDQPESLNLEINIFWPRVAVNVCFL